MECTTFEARVKLATLTEGPDMVNGKRPWNNTEIFNFVLVCNTALRKFCNFRFDVNLIL